MRQGHLLALLLAYLNDKNAGKNKNNKPQQSFVAAAL